MLPIDRAPRVQIGDKKYLNPAEKGTLVEAKEFCSSRNMDVVSFESKFEQDSVMKFLQDAGLDKNPIMTSLKNDNEKNVDGLKWAHKSGGGECSAVLTCMLTSTPCEAKINFMCEARKSE